MDTLTLGQLDALTLAMFADVSLSPQDFAVTELVPFAEWVWLQGSGKTPHRIHTTGQLKTLERDLRSGQSVSKLAVGAPSGYIRIRRNQDDTSHTGWLSFLAMLGHAAPAAGLSKALASQLTGVVKEMEDNVHLHSRQPSTGLVAFMARPGLFEFVVLDRGIGVLASLREAQEFATVPDHGTALQLAVSDGRSRYGTGSGHGLGFSDLTVGVANSNALVRFRSGDHLLELDGRGHGTIGTRCVQRAAGSGFLIAVQVVPT